MKINAIMTSRFKEFLLGARETINVRIAFERAPQRTESLTFCFPCYHHYKNGSTLRTFIFDIHSFLKFVFLRFYPTDVTALMSMGNM